MYIKASLSIYLSPPIQARFLKILLVLFITFHFYSNFFFIKFEFINYNIFYTSTSGLSRSMACKSKSRALTRLASCAPNQFHSISRSFQKVVRSTWLSHWPKLFSFTTRWSWFFWTRFRRHILWSGSKSSQIHSLLLLSFFVVVVCKLSAWAEVLLSPFTAALTTSPSWKEPLGPILAHRLI